LSLKEAILKADNPLIPKQLILVQGLISLMVFPLFFFFGQSLDPLPSLVFSFLSYWLMLTAATLGFMLFNPATSPGLKAALLGGQKRWWTLLGFIPVLGVFAVVFLPNLGQFNLLLVAAVLVIALFNALLEEVFWRGLALVHFPNSKVLLGLSTLLFTGFHFAFLFLPLEYQGGALNLVGGAGFMGLLWLVVSLVTKNITGVILAHFLVNFMAFLGLFIDNSLV
jgi:membrane protease YdiL (CAAX protease family)